MLDGCVNEFFQDRSVSSKGAQCNVFNISANSLPTCNNGLCDSFISEYCFSFKIANMSSFTSKIFNFWFLPCIFRFENLLPPWSFVSLNLNLLGAPFSDVASFLHVLLDPEETFVIIFDTYGAVHSSSNLIPYQFE